MRKTFSGKNEIPAFEKITPAQKLLFCIALSVIVFFIANMAHMGLLPHFMIAWDTFSVGMIVMSWITISITGSRQIRAQARIQDSSRSVVFFIMLVSTLAGFLAVLLLIVTKQKGMKGIEWQLPLAIAGMLLSWILIHTIFTLRYAHLFFGDHDSIPDTHAGGLEFPGNELPDYFDFAYFSFVIGMTFQVSDVQITSKKLRKMALFHAWLSFGFNTIMIALTINLIAGFGQ
jgi:uncharacterized membrane protein